MRQIAHLSLATLALALIGCGEPAAAVPTVAVGAAAPAFELQDLDGKTHRLADYRGRVVVLEWVNPKCPFSKRHAEQRTMTDLAAGNDVVWLGINSTAKSHGNYLDAAAHRSFNQSVGVTYPVLYDSDGRVARAYGAATTPHMIVIDEQGAVHYNGAIDDDPSGREDAPTNYVASALAAKAAGRAADPATTKPYGCSIKFAD